MSKNNATKKQNFMAPIEKDIDSILTLEEKKKLLKEIGQEDLLNLFKKNYKPPQFTSISPQKKAPLDQQINFAISKKEKDMLSQELFEIRKIGPGISISSYVRHKAISDIDFEEWSEQALEMLKKLNTPLYDEKEVKKQHRMFMKLVEESDDEDDLFLYRKELEKCENALSALKRQPFKRAYRVSGRVTFQEAQMIRWRAARLSLAVSDYMRYVMFGYKPGDKADLNMSLASRKRFYVSVLDVYRNGWGEPPIQGNCPNCMRYVEEIKTLQKQIKRYRELGEEQ